MSSRINQSLAFLNNLKKIPLSAQSVDCLFSTESFKPELLKQIAGAQKRIYLTALYLEADQAGEEILMALYQAKQNNPSLKIVVCIDFHRAQRGLIGDKESSGTNASWYQKIAKVEGLGVEIVGIPVKRKELFGVQHLKGFIFDDQVLYSGASLNNIYLQQNGRYRYDRYWLINNHELAESMIRFLQDEILSSGATASLNAESIPAMADFKNAHRKLTKNLKLASFKYSGQSLSNTLSVVPLCGLGARNNKLNNCIRKLLQSVQNEMVIFTPYFNLPAALSRDISSLLKRGVSLTIVIGDKTANDFYITEDKPFRTIGGLPYLYESNLRQFAKQHQNALLKGSLNIHLWKDGDNSFHLKGIYSDQRFMLLTGHNLNPRAWRLDVENALLIDDPKQEIKVLVDKELHEILKNTRKIMSPADIDDLEQYPEHVRKLLTRMRRIKADRIVKGII